LGEGTCEDAVTGQLLALHQRRAELLKRDGAAAADEYFYAEQNARVARNAEHYYRTMMHGRISSWNIRDRHMAEILAELLQHLERRGRNPKVIVWAHNSHLGDARATDMGAAGELNLGQLARETYGTKVKNIGFTTYKGTVTAASDWGGAAETKQVRPALAGSFEQLFHAVGQPRFFLPLPAGSEVHELLSHRQLERAIGVIYRPQTERQSHYFHARLASQFDAIIHLDETRALQPLERIQPPPEGEPPETFPEGT
jgi:erythromycin esterase-like protein